MGQGERPTKADRKLTTDLPVLIPVNIQRLPAVSASPGTLALSHQLGSWWVTVFLLLVNALSGPLHHPNFTSVLKGMAPKAFFHPFSVLEVKVSVHMPGSCCP